MRACRVGSLQATLDTFNKTWIHNVYVQGAETLREDTSTSFLETNSTNYKLGYKSTLEVGRRRDAVPPFPDGHDRAAARDLRAADLRNHRVRARA